MHGKQRTPGLGGRKLGRHPSDLHSGFQLPRFPPPQPRLLKTTEQPRCRVRRKSRRLPVQSLWNQAVLCAQRLCSDALARLLPPAACWLLPATRRSPPAAHSPPARATAARLLPSFFATYSSPNAAAPASYPSYCRHQAARPRDCGAPRHAPARHRRDGRGEERQRCVWVGFNLGLGGHDW